MLNNDYFLKQLKNIKLALIDLDGTVYLENQPLDGVFEALDKMRQKGIKLVFLTNNSSKTQAEYIEKLKKMKLFKNDRMFTSVEATADYLQLNNLNKSVYVFASEKVCAEFERFGVSLKQKDADVAVMTYNTTFNYQDVCALHREILRGARYVATNADLVCPAKECYLPDCGSFIKMFETSAKRVPEIVLGKPNTYMGEMMMREFNVSKNQVMMIGDRLYTDVRFGKNCGFLTALVLSGETSLEMLEKSEDIPDGVFKDIKQLTDNLD